MIPAVKEFPARQKTVAGAVSSTWGSQQRASLGGWSWAEPRWPESSSETQGQGSRETVTDPENTRGGEGRAAVNLEPGMHFLIFSFNPHSNTAKVPIWLEFLFFPGGTVVKSPPAKGRDMDLIPGLGRSPGKGNGNPLQYSCLENPMDRGAWRPTVHGITESWTRLSDWIHIHTYFLAQEPEGTGFVLARDRARIYSFQFYLLLLFFGCGSFLESLLNLLQYYCCCLCSGFLAMSHVEP